jgi:hypothetical protein
VTLLLRWAGVSTRKPFPNEFHAMTSFLGMALATYADRTIVLVADKRRPMADLGGLNYVQLTDADECLDKIRRRL